MSDIPDCQDPKPGVVLIRMMEFSSADRILVRLIRSSLLSDGGCRFPSDISIEDWTPIVERARLQGLAPLLYASLKRYDPQPFVPPQTFQDLRLAYIRADVANWQAYEELAQLLQSFGREQIPLILLKGSALAISLYPAIALRPMGDLDLLIPQPELPRARALLIKQGYVPSVEVRDGFRQDFEDVLVFQQSGARPLLIEVHWDLFHSAYYHKRIPIEWFWQRTTQISIGDQPAQIFSPEAQLIHLMAHWYLQHQGRRLLWSYDLALLLARYREQIHWREIIEAAQSFELSRVLDNALARVSDVWGVSVSEDVHAQIKALRPSVGERIAFSAFTAQRAEAKVVLNGLDVPGWRKLLYLYQVIFPSPAYMQLRYRMANARLLPFYYIWRLYRGVSRLLLSVLSMLTSVFRTWTGSPDA